MENKKLPRITILGKRIILSLLAFVLIWPLTVGVYTLIYKGYTHIDRTTFPNLDSKLKETLDKTPPDAPELMSRALDMATAAMVRQGLTGVHEAGTSLELVELYRAKIAADELPVRI